MSQNTKNTSSTNAMPPSSSRVSSLLLPESERTPVCGIMPNPPAMLPPVSYSEEGRRVCVLVRGGGEYESDQLLLFEDDERDDEDDDRELL